MDLFGSLPNPEREYTSWVYAEALAKVPARHRHKKRGATIVTGSCGIEMLW
jgi:hypothetical protein